MKAKKLLIAITTICLLCIGNFTFAFEMTAPNKPMGGDAQILNGAEVTTPGAWPATFIFRSKTGSCTATAVGEQVIITAAHCIPDNAQGTVRIGDAPTGVICTHHPDYGTGNSTTDFALCLADTPMNGFPFENVSTAIAYPRLGHVVTLLGFGCTKEGGHDGGFGVPFTGNATVVRTPEGSDIDTITEGGAAVCFGDSGGAAFYKLTKGGNRRALIAINSRGDINKYSFLSTTATPQFVDWALSWSKANNVLICGLDVAAGGCR